jgi:hypothetical protein
MSATRDSSQPITFIYSNLHEIYRKGLDAARQAEVPEQSPSASESRQHPRFSERKHETQSSGPVGLRSETYQIQINPQGERRSTRASLRSSKRVLKAGSVDIKEMTASFQPIHFLRRSTDTADKKAKLSVHQSGVQRSIHAPQFRLNLSEALQGSVGQQHTAPKVRESLQSLDRLQSRLHFLLKEIQEFSGQKPDDSGSE